MGIGEPIWLKMRGNRPAAVLDAFGIYEAPVPVFEIVRKMGVKLISDRSMGAVLGAVIGHGDGRAEIRVNAGFPEEYQRWTVAHELGHLLLHRLGQPFLSVWGKLDPRDRTEREADAFAAAFLMPTHLIYAYKAPAETPSGLAAVLGVPDERMSARIIETLG